MVVTVLALMVLAAVGVLALGWLFSWPLVRLFDPLYEPLAHQAPRSLSSQRLQHRILRAAVGRISIGIHGGVMAPTSYEVRLSPDDVEVLGGLRDWFANELAGAIADATREKGAQVARPPSVAIVEDDSRPRSRPRVTARFEAQTQAVPSWAAGGGNGSDADATVHEGTVALASWTLVPVGDAAAPGDAGAIRLAGAELVLGRSRAADATLDDATVSSRHLRLRCLADGRWEATDLGSTNGTRLNGDPLTGSAVLSEGDQLRIGAVTWRLERR